MELVQVLKRGLQQITGHGGLRGYLRVFFRTNDAKVGTLVGEDKYGNKYYEDNKQFFGRHRWVVYTTEMNGKNTFWDVDGSMVPPEWCPALSCSMEWPMWQELKIIFNASQQKTEVLSPTSHKEMNSANNRVNETAVLVRNAIAAFRRDSGIEDPTNGCLDS
uniref:NADH dehydrogenase [ubiquinone] 1 alpha subcomplex subunit 12 n=2 Tax=Homo sapiens TaxID=9606 RepID=H0YID5_HUMAN